jgi:hypothetical protein
MITAGVHTTKFESSPRGGWELSVRSEEGGAGRIGLGNGVGEIMLSVA